MPVFVRHDLADEGHAVEIHRETEPQCPLFAFPGFKRVDFTREFQRVTPRLHHLLRENGEPCPGFSEHRGPHAAVQNSDPEFRLKPRDEAARDRKIKRLRGRGFREPAGFPAGGEQRPGFKIIGFPHLSGLPGVTSDALILAC